MIIAIDPGYAVKGDGCAVAIFTSSAIPNTILLRGTCFDRPEIVRDRCIAIESIVRVIWECPQLDARSRRATPAVVGLAATGGELAGLYAGANAGTIERVTPAQWKGSVPKPIAHARTWRVLTPHEREILGGATTEAAIAAAQKKGALDRWGKDGARYYPARFTMHNLLDAVGIGLWAIGGRS